MTFTFGASCGGNSQNAQSSPYSVSVGTSVPAGAFVVVVVATDQAALTTPAVTDSQSNTYSLDVSRASSSPFGYVFSSVISTALASSDTISVSSWSGSDSLAIAAAYWTINHTGATLDQSNSGHGSTSTTSSGSVTTTQAAELIIGMIGPRGTTVSSEDTGNGFSTALDEAPSGTQQGVHMGYQVVSSTGSFTYQPSLAAAASWVSAIATYYESGSATGGSTSKSDSDSGTGSEGVPSQIGVSSSDSGTGTELQALAASFAEIDSGTGSESQALAASFAEIDSGTGSESQFLLVRSGDSGSGKDGKFPTGPADSDTGSGGEEQAVSAALADSDAGTGSEGHFITLNAADAGTGSEGHFITLNAADSGSGLGSQQLIARLAASDAGSSSEIQQSAASLDGADAGTGSEPGTTVTAHVGAIDTGTGTEAQFFTPGGLTPVADSDSGRGQEGDQEPAASSDSGTGTEVQVLSAATSDADSGTGADTESLRMAINYVSSSDAGIGTGTRNATARAIFLAESAAGTDSQGTMFDFSLADSASGAEAQDYAVIVFPFPPPWLFYVPQGGVNRYRLHVRPFGTVMAWVHENGEQTVLREFPGSLGGEMHSIGLLVSRLEGSDSVRLVDDADSGNAGEHHLPTAHVDQLVMGRMP